MQNHQPHSLAQNLHHSLENDRAATLLENKKYQASENEGYAGRFEHLNEVGHFACFDKNCDSSTHLSKNGKYQAENTGYDGDSERVNESVPECLEAEAKFNLSTGNSAFNDPKVSSGSKANVLNQHKSTEEQPIARKVVASRASCTEKVSHRLYQSVNRKRKKQRSNSCGEILISKQLPCPRSTVNLTTAQKKPRKRNADCSFDLCCAMCRKRKKQVKQLWINLNFKETPMPALYREPDHRSEKTKVSSGSKANVVNQHKSTEEQPIAINVVASRASCTEKVSHILYQSVNRKRNADCSFDLHCAMYRKRKKQRSNNYGEISISKQLPCLPSTMNQTTAQIKPRYACYAAYFLRALCCLNLVGLGDKFLIKIEEKIHDKEEETGQLQARIQENKEAEIKQLRRNLNFKATPMPAFYLEPGCCSEKNKDGQSWEEAGARAADLSSKTKSQSRPSTAVGARTTSATENTVRCLRAEVYNRCSTNKHLNMADSPQVSEVTIHPLAELSDISVPSVVTSKTSKQTQSNRKVAPKREQEKRQVTNYPRPRTSDSIRRNKDFKAEDKTKNNIEGINSDKSIDSGRPSLDLHSSSCHSIVQEPEVGSSYVDKNLEHNSSLVVCSSSGLESQGSDSSTSTSANQQILDLNLALAFQKKLSDLRITSMLKRKGRHTDRELANLFLDKGLDPNFAVMLKENGLDPMILALLQRSSLDVDREYRDSNPPVTDSNDVEDVLPNHILFSEKLRRQGLGK
ncbi:hypothetical protein BC332_33575 [Capsicum chinense]|nr:hypothetical protein BC332_33575 [Capsicum chinense]